MADPEEHVKMTNAIPSDVDTEPSCNEGVPMDHGWSWVICFSVFTITLLQFGHDQAIFVLFVDFVEEFQQPASVMTSMFTIFSLTSALSSLATSNILMPRYSTRQITCMAAILGSAFTLLLSLSPNVVAVLVIFGLKGACFGILLVCPTSLLGFYFRRRRSFATGISNTGLCAAFILFPPLTQVLREAYGLRGTLLILSALELHIVVVAMLLRPVETYRKFHRARRQLTLLTAANNDRTRFDLDVGHKSVPPRSHEDAATISNDECIKSQQFSFPCQDSTQETCINTTSQQASYCAGEHTSTFDHADFDVEKISLQNLNPTGCACAEELKEPLSIYRDQSEKKENPGDETDYNYQECQIVAGKKHRGFLKTIMLCLVCKETRHEDIRYGCQCCESSEKQQRSQDMRNSRTSLDQDAITTKTKKMTKGNRKNTWSSLFDISLLKIWPFRMVLVANGLGTFTSYVNIYIPTVAVKAGLSNSQAVSLLTVVGSLDLCSRVALGYLADTGLVAKTKIVATCLACIAALCHFNRFYTTYTHFLVYAACVGLTCGCRHNLLNVILIDHVGVDRLAKGLGLCSLLNTALLAANHVTIGVLLDATGSFVVPFHFVGTIVLAGSLLYFAEPLFVRLERARNTSADCV